MSEQKLFSGTTSTVMALLCTVTAENGKIVHLEPVVDYVVLDDVRADCQSLYVVPRTEKEMAECHPQTVATLRRLGVVKAAAAEG